MLFSGLLGLGGQEHGHEPALHLGGLIHGGHVGAKLRELLQQIPADIRMRHLAAAEADGDLHPVAVSQELLRIFQHGLKVAGIQINRKMLSEMAINDAVAFTALCDIAKKA